MKSTLAPNWRYISLRAHMAQPMEEKRFTSELIRALTWQIGVEGMQQTQASVISFDAPSSHLVIRCMRGSERRLIASLALLSRVGEQTIRIERLKI
ncbi:Rpp14/Pop5 family protein [uncultured archaeon]|nr:Rpp14/Pop5 family protein [uncultured archaeon]